MDFKINVISNENIVILDLLVNSIISEHRLTSSFALIINIEEEFYPVNIIEKKHINYIVVEIQNFSDDFMYKLSAHLFETHKIDTDSFIFLYNDRRELIKKERLENFLT